MAQGEQLEEGAAITKRLKVSNGGGSSHYKAAHGEQLEEGAAITKRLWVRLT